jgi:hypothetical protein
MPVMGQLIAQACLSMCGCALKPSSAARPTRSTILENPAVVNGAPRSDVNTKGLAEAADQHEAALPYALLALGHAPGCEMTEVPVPIDTAVGSDTDGRQRDR